MSKWQVIERSIVFILITAVLWGCGGGSPTPIIIVPPTTVNSAPVMPTVARPLPTTIPPTATIAPAIPTQLTTTELATTAEVTTTPEPAVPTENPMNRPFLMKIDRISVVTGRGTLLEGTIARGTMQGNQSVEILGASKDTIHTTALAVLISGTVRDQVVVGNYAGILVQYLEATNVSPGMVLAEAGGYDSYEEAIQELQ